MLNIKTSQGFTPPQNIFYKNGEDFLQVKKVFSNPVILERNVLCSCETGTSVLVKQLVGYMNTLLELQKYETPEEQAALQTEIASLSNEIESLKIEQIILNQQIEIIDNNRHLINNVNTTADALEKITKYVLQDDSDPQIAIKIVTGSGTKNPDVQFSPLPDDMFKYEGNYYYIASQSNQTTALQYLTDIFGEGKVSLEVFSSNQITTKIRESLKQYVDINLGSLEKIKNQQIIIDKKIEARKQIISIDPSLETEHTDTFIKEFYEVSSLLEIDSTYSSNLLQNTSLRADNLYNYSRIDTKSPLFPYVYESLNNNASDIQSSINTVKSINISNKISPLSPVQEYTSSDIHEFKFNKLGAYTTGVDSIYIDGVTTLEETNEHTRIISETDDTVHNISTLNINATTDNHVNIVTPVDTYSYYDLGENVTVTSGLVDIISENGDTLYPIEAVNTIAYSGVEESGNLEIDVKSLGSVGTTMPIPSEWGNEFYVSYTIPSSGIDTTSTNYLRLIDRSTNYHIKLAPVRNVEGTYHIVSAILSDSQVSLFGQGYVLNPGDVVTYKLVNVRNTYNSALYSTRTYVYINGEYVTALYGQPDTNFSNVILSHEINTTDRSVIYANGKYINFADSENILSDFRIFNKLEIGLAETNSMSYIISEYGNEVSNVISNVDVSSETEWIIAEVKDYVTTTDLPQVTSIQSKLGEYIISSYSGNVIELIESNVISGTPHDKIISQMGSSVVDLSGDIKTEVNHPELIANIESEIIELQENVKVTIDIPKVISEFDDSVQNLQENVNIVNDPIPFTVYQESVKLNRLTKPSVIPEGIQIHGRVVKNVGELNRIPAITVIPSKIPNYISTQTNMDYIFEIDNNTTTNETKNANIVSQINEASTVRLVSPSMILNSVEKFIAVGKSVNTVNMVENLVDVEQDNNVINNIETKNIDITVNARTLPSDKDVATFAISGSSSNVVDIDSSAFMTPSINTNKIVVQTNDNISDINNDKNIGISSFSNVIVSQTNNEISELNLSKYLSTSVSNVGEPFKIDNGIVISTIGTSVPVIISDSINSNNYRVFRTSEGTVYSEVTTEPVTTNNYFYDYVQDKMYRLVSSDGYLDLIQM